MTIYTMQGMDDPIPHNVEAEQQLLGAMLLHEEAIGKASSILETEDLADPVHATIFDAILAKHERGEMVSPITVKGALLHDPGLRELGGPSYLARLAGSAVSPGHVADYARLIKDAAHRRLALQVLRDAQAALVKGAEATGDVMGRLEAALVSLTPADTKLRPRSFLSASTEAIKQMQSAHRGDAIAGIVPPWHQLSRIIPAFRAGDMVVMGGRPSMGKAQPLDEPVLLASGQWRNMGELRLGDALASPDGAPSRVVGIYPQGRRPVFRVTFSDGRAVRCCGEHLWEVHSSRFKGARVVDTVTMKEMIGRERYRRRLSVPLVSGHFGRADDLPVDPWLLGVLIGNGNLTNGTPRVSLADARTLWQVREVIGEAHRITACGDYDYTIAGNGGANEVTAGLRALGLMGKRSEEKRIPSAYLQATYPARLNLLRGLLDTDGWVETFGAIRYSTSSSGLAEDVAALVRSLGGVCSIAVKAPKFTHKGEHRDGLPHCVLNIRHDRGEEMFTLLRKKRRCQRQKQVLLTVASIEPDGDAEVQCIAVSHPSRLYVTSGYTLTHNTAIALSMATAAAQAGHPVVIASLEMTPEDMAMRALSEATSEAGEAVPYTSMSDGSMTERQFRHTVEVWRSLEGLPITFLSEDFRKPGQLIAGVKAALKQMGPMGGKTPLIVIDYMQLLQGQGRDLREQITDISKQMKYLARSLNAVNLSLSQLSRAVEQRQDKRPMLSDLRETGQVEQDADAVIFCHRRDYYLEREQPDVSDAEAFGRWQEEMERERGKLELIVAKHRRGPIGVARMRFYPACNRVWED
jgi:replicative DNA helicase